MLYDHDKILIFKSFTPYFSRRSAFDDDTLNGLTFRAALTRSGVKGTVRSRMPIASKIALPIAAGIGLVVASPAPTDGWSGRLIGSMITSGTSENLRIGYKLQSRLVTIERSNLTSSLSVRLVA